MVNAERLLAELQAALPVTGCAVRGAAPDDSGPLWTAHPAGQQWVRVVWAAPPSAAQQSQAAALVAAHDGSATEAERLDRLRVPPRLLLALAVRASSNWGGLSAARKARVLAVIDAAADQGIAALD